MIDCVLLEASSVHSSFLVRAAVAVGRGRRSSKRKPAPGVTCGVFPEGLSGSAWAVCFRAGVGTFFSADTGSPLLIGGFLRSGLHAWSRRFVIELLSFSQSGRLCWSRDVSHGRICLPVRSQICIELHFFVSGLVPSRTPSSLRTADFHFLLRYCYGEGRPFSASSEFPSW